MKLWQKLLPVATAAATVAVVAPMATSCSKTLFGTSDFEFKPTEQHKEEDITYSATDVTKVEALLKEYIGTPTRFAKDYAYSIAKSQKAQKTALEEQKKAGTLESFALDFYVSISNFSATEKQVDLGTTYGGKINGYVVSGELSMHQHSEMLTAKKETETGSGIYVQLKTTSDSTKKQKINNCFVCINPTDSTLYILGQKDLKWSSVETASSSTNATIYYTGKENFTDVTSGTSNHTSGYNYIEKPDIYTVESFNTKGLFYLEKVTFKPA